MSDQPGNQYRHPSGLEIKLLRRVPDCENALWFVEVTKAADRYSPVGDTWVVSGGALGTLWEEL